MHTFFLLALLALLPNFALAQGTALTGTVVDQSGAPVADATVRLELAGAPLADTRTGTNGQFEFTIEATGALRIVVTAPGFAPAMETVQADVRTVRITLEPAPFFEAVNVTSSRTDVPKADPTATVTVITSSELLTSAAVSLDDALKMVPGFTLFRRTSSRAANPTSQGVSLRGIGGASPSRSLVLADGMPLNDAFGGWIYWDKVPQAAIDRIEVERGSGSDLYGADAVGGVVQILTVRPGRPTGRAILEGGNLGSGRVSLFGGARAGGLNYSAGGEWFTFDGYKPVAEQQDPGIAPRGPVDSNLGSAHRSAIASAGYQAANGWRIDASGSVFSEDRENATPVTINTTASRQGAGAVAGGVAGGFLAVRAYGGTQDYHQTFSTVNATRTAEALNREQMIPSTSAGMGGQWVRPAGAHALLFGAEWKYIKGSSIETPYTAGRALATISPGGKQKSGSAFVQDTITVNNRLTLVLGAHGDAWHSQAKTAAEPKSSSAFNPRAAASYRLADGLTVRGSVYQGFRAPTLNEFYRSFSAGSTQTLPNENLGPEKLTGTDGGILISHGPASARVTGYWTELHGAITAVTRSSTPTAIIRQRDNAGTLRATGLELEGEVRLPRSFSVGFASGIMSSHFRGNTPLAGKRTAQVPSYNVGLNLRYTQKAWTASSQVRVTGPQFEDDLNVFTLRRATVVDVFGSRTIAGRLNAFVAVENLFDEIYDVGRTPILTTGLPRTARAGVVITLP
jgi:outer membrane receptor protein involved in Fe transport